MNKKTKIALGLSSLFLAYKFFDNKKTDKSGNKKYVMVTGTSTGIGKIIAEFLAANNYQVIATVRKESDKENLKNISDNIIPVIMDVSVHESVLKAKEEIIKILGDNKLFSLINNAGIAVGGPIELLPMEELRKQFDVNVFGLIDTTQIFFDLLDKNDSKIINMSSVSGEFSYPFLGAYAASKHALEALSDAMRRELLNTGIDVIVVQPASIVTPIWDKARDVDKPYINTHYGTVMEKMKEITLDTGKNGEKPEKLGELIVDILSRKKNKSRYVIAKNPLKDVYITRLMPDKVIDKAIKTFFYK